MQYFLRMFWNCQLLKFGKHCYYRYLYEWIGFWECDQNWISHILRQVASYMLNLFAFHFGWILHNRLCHSNYWRWSPLAFFTSVSKLCVAVLGISAKILVRLRLPCLHLFFRAKKFYFQYSDKYFLKKSWTMGPKQGTYMKVVPLFLSNV